MKTTKKLLLVTPSFFGYERDIAEACRANGVDVDLFDERPSNSSFAKALFRLRPSLAKPYTERYFQRILKSTERVAYDFVLIIKGEVVPLSFVEALRQRNPNARFMYYSFDSIPISSNCTTLFPAMDKLYSFDPTDVALYPRMQLKHLFYTPHFDRPARARRTNELAFIGTLHSDRFSFVTSLFRSFERTYRYFYVPARWYFAMQKYVTRKFAPVRVSDVSFRKLDKTQVANVFLDSVAVLDIQRSGQTGLTMRTFEVLAAGAILVTGNEAIRHTALFDPERVVVMADYSAESASDRLRNQLAGMTITGPPVGFDQHSVFNWVKTFVE